MEDYAAARTKMVDCQLRTNDVTDYAVLAAMGEIPRERFVPARMRPLAYIDEDIRVKDASAGAPARYLMEPAPFARLVQLAGIAPSDIVLDIGCATGYSTALLSRLAGTVVGLEPDAELAAAARAVLAQLGATSAQIVVGPMTNGVPEAGPYDAIILNGAVDVIPEPLFEQLKEAGRLVAVVRAGPLGRATLHVRRGGVVSKRPLFDAAVPVLQGFEAPRRFVF